MKTIRSGESRSSVRISDFESFETAKNLKGMVDWVWIDFFESFPLGKSEYESLKQMGYKICLVSPELSGHPDDMLNLIHKLLLKDRISLEAVCTKYPQKWEKYNLYFDKNINL